MIYFTGNILSPAKPGQQLIKAIDVFVSRSSNNNWSCGDALLTYWRVTTIELHKHTRFISGASNNVWETLLSFKDFWFSFYILTNTFAWGWLWWEAVILVMHSRFAYHALCIYVILVMHSRFAYHALCIYVILVMHSRFAYHALSMHIRYSRYVYLSEKSWMQSYAYRCIHFIAYPNLVFPLVLMFFQVSFSDACRGLVQWSQVVQEVHFVESDSFYLEGS